MPISIPKKRKKRNPLIDRALYLLLMFFGFLLRRVSRRHSVVLAHIVGDFAYNVLKIRRSMVEKNLAITFPGNSKAETDRITRQVYRNMAENVIEVLCLPLIRTAADASRLVSVDAREFLSKTRGSNKGAVCVSAHFGNWELLSVSLGLLVSPFSLVVKRLKNRDIDRQINRWRSMRGNTVVYKRQALREGLRTLNAGGIMSMLGDQSDPNGGFFMDFLGRRASVFLGPAFLALKTGVPLFVMMCRRAGNGKYIVEIEEVDSEGLGNAKADAEELTRRYTRVLERFIYQYPEEWFWLHDRWKRLDC